MVIEREREIRGLTSGCARPTSATTAASPRWTRSPPRLEEIQAQARGQATRIRMKALREAVEVSRRVQELTEAAEAAGDASPAANGNGQARPRRQLFEGLVKLEIGPLGDFSQLVGFEDAVGRSAPPRSRSSASPRAARPSRCASTSRSSCCASWRSSPARVQGPPHRPRQPDPRRRRGQGPEQRAA